MLLWQQVCQPHILGHICCCLQSTSFATTDGPELAVSGVVAAEKSRFSSCIRHVVGVQLILGAPRVALPPVSCAGSPG